MSEPEDYGMRTARILAILDRFFREDITDLEEQVADQQFAALLSAHSLTTCPSCAKPIDRGDLAWNNASTGYTPYSVVEILCQRCDHELLFLKSWKPSIRDIRDVILVLETDWI